MLRLKESHQGFDRKYLKHNTTSPASVVTRYVYMHVKTISRMVNSGILGGQRFSHFTFRQLEAGQRCDVFHTALNLWILQKNCKKSRTVS